MKQIICNIATLIMTIILVWILLSYINVIMHNTQIGYTYPVWNLFTYIKYGRKTMVKGYSVPDGYMGLLNGKYQLFETEQAYYECLLESEEI